MSKASWARIPERGSTAGLRFGLWLLRTFGYTIGYPVALFSALYFFVTGKTSRNASFTYLKKLHEFAPHAAGPASLRKSFIHHWNFAINIVDRMWFWQGRLDHFEIRAEGRAQLQRLRGGILIGAHFGNFDALRAISHDRDMNIHIVMYRAHAQKINHIFNKLNPEAGIKVWELDGSDLNQVFLLKEKIDEGAIIALLGDRPPPYGRARVSWVPFLGEPAPFPQNAWLLASMMECPVYFVAGIRTGTKRYRVFAERLTDRVEIPRACRQEKLKSYIEIYAQRIERLCVEYPYQWFNFYDFWKHNVS